MSVGETPYIDRAPDHLRGLYEQRGLYRQTQAKIKEDGFLRGILRQAATPKTESYSLLAQVARGDEEKCGAVVTKLVPLVIGEDTRDLLDVPEGLKREMDGLRESEGELSNFSVELTQFLKQKFALYLTKTKIEAMLTCADFRVLGERDKEAYSSLFKKLSDLSLGGATVVFNEGYFVPVWTEEKEQEVREAHPDLEFLPFLDREINFCLVGPGSY